MSLNGYVETVCIPPCNEGPACERVGSGEGGAGGGVYGELERDDAECQGESVAQTRRDGAAGDDRDDAKGGAGGDEMGNGLGEVREGEEGKKGEGGGGGGGGSGGGGDSKVSDEVFASLGRAAGLQMLEELLQQDKVTQSGSAAAGEREGEREGWRE